MPTPSNRTPIRVGRGTKSALTSSLSDLKEGEIVYATDENQLYVIEGGALTAGEAVTNLTYTAGTRVIANTAGTDVTLPEVAAGGDSGLMTGADKTKIDGIEASATADQTGAEIKSAYEGESDTNAFTDAEQTKLSALPTNASLTTTLAAKADLSGGKLSVSQVPDLAISEFKGAVANQSAMLAITGEKGDWVTRNDDGKVYLITGDDPTSASDWTALSYPVQDVAGATLGTFTGSTISDNGTLAAGLQELETAVETKASNSIYADTGITANTGLLMNTTFFEDIAIDGTTDSFASSSDVNLNTGNVHLYTDVETATALNTVNFRWDGSTTLASKMSVSQACSVTVIAASSGDTTRAPSTFSAVQIDGSATNVTLIWQGNAIPEDTPGGQTSSDNKDHHVYTFTIIKTASTPAYVVLASVVRFGLVPD